VRHALLALLSLLPSLAGCAAGAPPASPRAAPAAVALDQRGGDAWAFERRITGRASSACASVEVRSALGRVEASPAQGRFAAVVRLPSGESAVRVACVGRGGAVLGRAEVLYRVRLADRPEARLRLAITEGGLALEAGGSATRPVTRAPLTAFRFASDASNPEPLSTAEGAPLADARGPRVLLRPPRRDGVYVVRLEVRDGEGGRDAAEAYFRVAGGAVLLPDLARDPPPWAERAVVYGAVPFLFGEPPLRAVLERLPALAALGVNTLWLTPVQDAPEGDFGYEVLDHFTLRASFGEPADLEALVGEAHRLGVRVLLDFVPNHTSSQHPYFLDAEAHGARSPYYGFYERDAEGRPVHYFDWEHLPNLDYDHPEVRRMILEAAAEWVRRYDVDGYRVDVAWGVFERAPGFFDALRAELVRIKAQALLLAEASAREPQYYAGGFDAAYDWTRSVGTWSWRDVFVEDHADLRALGAALTASEGARGFVFRFLENNDTGPRFAATHGAGMHRVASAMLFTLPGIPSLFTGEEVLARYEPYQQERPLSFEGPPEVRAHLTRLAHLRASLEALRGRGLEVVEAAPSDRVFAYLRTARSTRGGAPALVALNFGEAPVTARLKLPPEGDALLAAHPEDRLDEGPPPTSSGGEWSVRLEGWGARVLTRDDRASAHRFSAPRPEYHVTRRVPSGA
jgi:glycosidase